MPKKRRLFLTTIGIVLAIVLVFGNTIKHDFVLFDDNVHVYENPHLKDPSWASIKRFWSAPYEGLYIPLTYTGWIAVAALSKGTNSDSKLSMMNPSPFHVVSIVLHCINALLTFAILLLLFDSIPAALCGALFFALHPATVEPVAWISGFKGLMSAMFSLLATFLFIRFRQEGERNRLYAAAFACFILALLAKPSVVIVPVMLLLMDRFFFKVSLKRSLLQLAPWLALTLPIIWITKAQQPNAVLLYTPTWIEKLFIASDALSFYLYLIFLPLRLSPDYARTAQTILQNPAIWLFLLCPWTLYMWAKRQIPAVYAGTALFAVALLPVSGFLTFNYQSFSSVADRYLYPAMLGASIAVAGWLAMKNRKWSYTMVGVIVTLFATQTYFQVQRWKDSETLFNHMLSVAPRSLIAQNNLGAIYESRREYREALKYFLRSIELEPRGTTPRYNAGRMYGYLGEFNRTAEFMQQVLQMKGSTPEVHHTLGLAYLQMGKLKDAHQQLQRAIDMGYPFSQPLLTETKARIATEAQAKPKAPVTKLALP